MIIIHFLFIFVNSMYRSSTTPTPFLIALKTLLCKVKVKNTCKRAIRYDTTFCPSRPVAHKYAFEN